MQKSPVKHRPSKTNQDEAADCEPVMRESPGKQISFTEEVAEAHSSPESAQSQQDAKEIERKAAFQREKDSLRAPFSELGGNKKKSSVESTKLDPSKRVSRITDVNKVIFVDSYILNYSTFFPGKLLGSTLNVGNLSNSE